MIDLITGLETGSALTILLRLSLSMIAGFIIGFERSTHNQAAGMRTHMVLSLGACGIMVLSILLPIEFASVTNNGDPARLAAQVISGIGFLGAGAILRFGFTVKGLTTAASIWTTSGIGLMFGAGFYILGGVSAILLVFILRVVDNLENWFMDKENLRVITVVFKDEDMNIKSVVNVLKNFVSIKKYSFTEEVEKGEVKIEGICKVSENQSIRALFEEIKKLGNVKTIKID